MTTKDLEVIQKRFPEYRLLHMRPDMEETEEAFDIFQDAIMKGEFSQFHPPSYGNGGTLMGYPLQYHGLASIVVSHGSSTTLWISVHPREMLGMARHGDALGETGFKPGSGRKSTPQRFTGLLASANGHHMSIPVSLV